MVMKKTDLKSLAGLIKSRPAAFIAASAVACIPVALFCGLQSAARAVGAAEGIADARVFTYNLKMLSYMLAPLLLLAAGLFFGSYAAKKADADRAAIGGKKAMGLTKKQIMGTYTAFYLSAALIGAAAGWIIGILGVQGLILLALKGALSCSMIALQIAWIASLVMGVLCVTLLTVIASLTGQKTVKMPILPLLSGNEGAADRKKSMIAVAASVACTAALSVTAISRITAVKDAGQSMAGWICAVLAAVAATAAMCGCFGRAVSGRAAERRAMCIHGYSEKQIKHRLYRDGILPSLIGLIIGWAIGVLLGYIGQPMIAGYIHFDYAPQWIGLILGAAVSVILTAAASLLSLHCADNVKKKK